VTGHETNPPLGESTTVVFNPAYFIFSRMLTSGNRWHGITSPR
jgi:hypothetical protein